MGAHLWIVVSAYIPPEGREEVDFPGLLGHLSELCISRGDSRLIIVAGDLNSKSQAWGSSNEDWRGRAVLDMAEDCDLLVVNHGNKPTF